MSYVIGLILGACVFIACIVSFSVGFKYGKAIREDRQPKIEPLKVIKEAVKEKPQVNTGWDEGFSNLMKYDGSPEAK